MATYFDSSALLAVLLDGPGATSVWERWESDPCRVTSILLEAECVTVVRRAARAAGADARSPGIRARLDALHTFVEAMVVHDVDAAVLDVLRRTDALSGARSLDALHVATVLLYRANMDEPLALCTLDRRMVEVAAAVGVETVPTPAR